MFQSTVESTGCQLLSEVQTAPQAILNPTVETRPYMRKRFLKIGDGLFAGREGTFLVLLSIIWGFVMMGQQIVSPLLPSIITDLGISAFAAGVALTLMWAAYSVSQYPGGILVDQLPNTLVLISGLGVALVGYTVLTMATSFPVFVAGTSIAGVGGGIYLVAMRTTIAEHFERQRGLAFGVNLSAGMIGNIIAAGIAIAIIWIGVWRLAFIPIVTGLSLLLLGLYRWYGEPYSISSVSFDLRGTVDRVFRTAEIGRLLLAFSLYSFTWQGSIGFIPTYLQFERGFSPTFASASFALLFAVGILVMPFAGRLSDQSSRRPLAIVFLVLATFSLVVVLFSDTRLAILIGLIGFSIGLMAYPPIMQAHLMDSFSSASMGGDFGAVRTVYSGIGALGPAYVGFIASRFDYTVAFSGFVLCLLGSAVVIRLSGSS